MLGARLVQTKLKAWQFPTVTTYQGGLLRYVYPAMWVTLNYGMAERPNISPIIPKCRMGEDKTEKFIGVLGLTQDCRVVLINTNATKNPNQSNSNNTIIS